MLNRSEFRFESPLADCSGVNGSLGLFAAGSNGLHGTAAGPLWGQEAAGYQTFKENLKLKKL